MTRLLAFLPVILFAFVATGLMLGLGRDPRALPSALINQPMPAFSLTPVRESDVPFTRDDLNGEVALVNVFASWCGPCRIEHPMLIDLARNQGVRVHGIDWKETPEAGRLYLAQAGDPYTRVGSDQSGRFALDLGVTGAPETFIIDRAGRIRFKQVGPITQEIWDNTIAPIIAEIESEP